MNLAWNPEPGFQANMNSSRVSLILRAGGEMEEVLTGDEGLV